MPKPNVEPRILCVKLEPGEQRDVELTISNTPSESQLSVSISSVASSIAIVELVAYHIFLRPLTEEEIAELPPHPRSIREQARLHGRVEELIESARSDGSTPLNIAMGQLVRVRLSCTAATGRNDDSLVGSVLIQGTNWETCEVPVVVMVARTSYQATIDPSTIRKAIEPGTTASQDLVVYAAPSTAKVVAFVSINQEFVRLSRIIAFHPVRKKFTPEEINELPPYPPSIREEARREGYFEYTEVARSDGVSPLAVAFDDMLRLYLDFKAFDNNNPDFVEATLIVAGSTWQLIEIPITLIIGQIRSQLGTDNLVLRHGETGELPATVSSLAGPDTVADLTLGDDDGKWRVEPRYVNLPKRTTVRPTLVVHLEPAAPIGTFQPGLEVRAFDGLMLQTLPLSLTVKPGRVTAKLQHVSVVVTRGTSVTCQVEVASEGGYKVISFEASNPPTGMRMAEAVRHISGKNTVIVPLTIVIEPRATLDKSTFGIRWTANDGEHQGVLFLDVTVVLPPDSRTFHQQIVTPSGTALGGFAEVTIRSDGSFVFKGHMHDSGFDPYAFRINAVLRSGTGIICMAMQKSGRVAGTIGSGSRDLNWNETGINELISRNWDDLRNGTVSFSKWYSDTGVLGTLEDIAIAVVEFFVGRVFVGQIVAAVIVIGSELGAAAEIPWLHPTVIAGVFVAGGLVLILGPGFIIPAVVAGAVAATEVKARPMRQSEINLARQVFGDTLPIDRILITNFQMGDRARCIANLDGSILICVGDRYDDLMSKKEDRTTLIHELTHAWQIAHEVILAGGVAQTVIDQLEEEGERYYGFTFDERKWSDFGIEQQAVIVATMWFALYEDAPDGGLQSQIALNAPWFRYIQDNIRAGVP